VRFRLLGQFEVEDDGRPLVLGGAQQRALLAILAIHRNTVVSVDRLADELWGESPPMTAVKTIQGYVSNLRKALGENRILTRGRGYLLDLSPEEVDVEYFEALAAQGRKALAAGDPSMASQQLSAALALWRDRYLAGMEPGPVIGQEAARLESERLTVLDDRIDADLAVGRHTALISELQSLVHHNPLRERLHGQLMLALYRAGRQADALEHYRQARRHLMTELGLEPGPALTQLELAILAHDPDLQHSSPPASVARSTVPRHRRRSRLRLAAIAAAAILGCAALVATSVKSSGTARVVSASPRGGVVFAIDPASERPVATINVGRAPGDVVSGSGSVWVLDANDGTITQIDPASRRVVKTFGAGAAPSRLAFADGSLWVGSSAGLTRQELDDGEFMVTNVARIDPDQSTLPFQVVTLPRPDVTRSFLLDNPSGIGSLVATPAAIWVIDPDGSVSHIDPRTGRVVATIHRLEAGSLAPDPTGVWVVGSEQDRGHLSLIERRSNTIAVRMTVPPPSSGKLAASQLAGAEMAAAADGALWVSDGHDGLLWRVGLTDRTILRLSQALTSQIAVGADSVWILDTATSTITRIDARTLRVRTSIHLPAPPQNLTFADGLLWVSAV
jgi:DNA-binding SARP family transcriptional activator/sugar lactone lactonase YvrE